jgi:hypothetical protein
VEYESSPSFMSFSCYSGHGSVARSKQLTLT